MTDKDLAELLEKIAGIQAKTTANGCTQHEAELAAAKMQELLLKYNVSLADVNRYAERTHRKVTHAATTFQAAKWREELLFVVARAHLCRAIRNFGQAPRGKMAMTVVGHDHNLIVAESVFNWLQDEIVRVTNAEHKRFRDRRDWLAVDRPANWKRAFQLGMVVGIRQSYAAMRRTVHADTGTRWAIVPVIEGEVERHVDSLFPDTKPVPPPRKVLSDPFQAGIDAGAKINVADRQVTGAPNMALPH